MDFLEPRRLLAHICCQVSYVPSGISQTADMRCVHVVLAREDGFGPSVFRFKA